jgi:uncharacterized protein DUF5615
VKIKLDENLGARAVAPLTAAGHDVSTVALQSMESAADREVIQACQREGRALVTLDLDFANPLNYRPSEYAGIAVLRPPRKGSAGELLKTVDALVEGLKRQPLTGKLWIVELGRIRIFQESCDE